MNNTKLLVCAGIMLAAGAAGSWMVLRPSRQEPALAGAAVSRPAAPEAVPPGFSRPATTEAEVAAGGEMPSAPALPRPEGGGPAAAARAAAPEKGARVKPMAAAAPAATPGGRKPKEPLRDPVAREALFFVGADREAEEYWLEAINDPGLSAHERKDLIEDLNEDGISEPKHPSLEDLPLILSRLRLIEEVGEETMDQANADAFGEAYKDLLNLADVAAGGGRSVQ